MEIVGYVAYASLVILAIAWTIVVRTNPGVETRVILRAVYFVSGAVIIAATGVHMAHSLWVIPFGCAFSMIIAPVLVKTPVVSIPFLLIAAAFSRIVRIGMPRHKDQEAQLASVRAGVD